VGPEPALALAVTPTVGESLRRKAGAGRHFTCAASAVVLRSATRGLDRTGQVRGTGTAPRAICSLCSMASCANEKAIGYRQRNRRWTVVGDHGLRGPVQSRRSRDRGGLVGPEPELSSAQSRAAGVVPASVRQSLPEQKDGPIGFLTPNLLTSPSTHLIRGVSPIRFSRRRLSDIAWHQLG
jgi:hypothetical protein